MEVGFFRLMVAAGANSLFPRDHWHSTQKGKTRSSGCYSPASGVLTIIMKVSGS